MTSNSKVSAIAMMTALLGGTAGAFITRTTQNTPQNQATTTPPATTATPPSPVAPTAQIAAQPVSETPSEVMNAGESEQLAGNDKMYRDGFAEGFRAAREESAAENSAPEQVVTRPAIKAAAPVTYRASRTRYSNAAPRSYGEPYRPAKRSFWSKHRDKLTVAGGAGGGAVLGALIGGKKGAAIGAIAGGAGSALYTYKIRKKGPRY